MKISKNRAFISHAVEVRRLKTFRTKFANITIAQVVAKEDDDVGLGRRNRLRPCERQPMAQKEGEQPRIFGQEQYFFDEDFHIG